MHLQLLGYIGAGKGKVPELPLAGQRRRETGLDAAVREILDPVGSSFGGAGEVLHNLVGEEGLGCIGKVPWKVVADEAEVLETSGTLDVGVRVSKSDAASRSVCVSFAD
jgi:hypothetical protein